MMPLDHHAFLLDGGELIRAQMELPEGVLLCPKKFKKILAQSNFQSEKSKDEIPIHF